MSISNELFFEAHRGLRQSPSKDYGLGMHWSADAKVAKHFAGAQGAHTVIHAQIPISSVETDRKVLDQRGVFDPRSSSAQFRNLAQHEQEISVRQGAPVQVTGITKYRRVRSPGSTIVTPQGIQRDTALKSRTRSYKRPRKMQA